MSLAKICSSSLCDFEGLDATMMQCPNCGRKIRCRYCYSTTGAHSQGCYRLKHPLKRGEQSHYNHRTPKQVFNAAEVEDIPRPKVVKMETKRETFKCGKCGIVYPKSEYETCHNCCNDCDFEVNVDG